MRSINYLLFHIAKNPVLHHGCNNFKIDVYNFVAASVKNRRCYNEGMAIPAESLR